MAAHASTLFEILLLPSILAALCHSIPRAIVVFAALLMAQVAPLRAASFVVQNEPHLQHAFALTRAALKAGGMDVNFVDAPAANERRNLFMISSGQTHVDMMPATPARLQLVQQGKLRVIKVPLDRGLLGYRLNLLLSSQRDKLAEVKTASDLAHFSMGQNVGWMDIEIYRASGILTKEVKRWSNGEFAEQMEAGFLDLFPLGLEETLSYFLPHLQQKYPQIIADPYLLVRYPGYRFVWVSPHPDDDALYAALQRGFNTIVDDGSYLRIWAEHRKPPPNAFFNRRTIIDLPNPFYDQNLVPSRYRQLLFRPVSQ